MNHKRDYLIGKLKPHYPVPATNDNAARACNYLFLSLCPYTEGPCNICIEKYLDNIEFDYLYDDKD